MNSKKKRNEKTLSRCSYKFNKRHVFYMHMILPRLFIENI